MLNIKGYFLNKLLFPKVVVIHKPGIIINQISRKYGGVRSRLRTIFFFEDIISILQSETIKKIGKEKTNNLWYKIGKDFTTRYLLLTKAKQPPSFLIPDIIKYMLAGFRSAGFSVAEKSKYNNKRKTLSLEGKDNLLCKKSEICEYSAGIISALMSFLHGTNIEAYSKTISYKRHFCHIDANPDFNKRYIPSISHLQPSKEYNKINFPKRVQHKSFHSLKDFIKFNKVNIDSSAKFYLKDYVIIPVEAGWLEIIVEHYNRLNLKNFLDEIITKESSNIAKNILGDISQKEKIEALIQILAALGWGFPYVKKSKDKIVINLIHPPWNKLGFSYQPLVINGFLNYITGKKLNIISTKSNKYPHSIKIEYASIK